METRIKERFGPGILEQARDRYDVADSALRELDGFESFIYEYTRGDHGFILRLSHSLRRSEDLILGEVDWIHYLAEGGASVARAVPSRNGRLVEAIDDGSGGRFLATSFVKARGRPPRDVGWSPSLYETFGRLMGRIHSLSQDYRPSDPAWRRPDWGDPIMQGIEENLPGSEVVVVEKYRSLMATLSSLPKGSDSWGLIHFDANGSNIVIDETGQITLFDFDDCAYGWYAYDIAMVLFYMVMGHEDREGFAREFLGHFLRGYAAENRLDHCWLRTIPHFLKHREIDLYAIIHRSFDVQNLEDPWCRRYMEGRKARIEAGEPYLELDFEALV